MKTTPLHILIIIIALSQLQNTQAQSKKLTISSKEEFNSKLLNSIPFKKEHLTTKDIELEIGKISTKLIHKGFFNNTFNLTTQDSTFNTVFTLNKKIDTIRVNYSTIQISTSFLNQISLRSTSKYFEIPTNEIESTLLKIASYFEKNGHSFTTCQLTNISLNKNKLNATLYLSISKKRKINNVIIKGYDQFPKKFIKHHLNLEVNKPFNSNLLKTISSKLKAIPFTSQIKEPEVLFTKDSTTLYLYLNKQNKNNFDGIIGFSNKKGSKNLQLNGNLNLNLNNTLNKGESISLNWRNDGQNSQKLNLKLSVPFLFNTPIGSSSNFSIIKQDSTYNTTSLQLSLNYHIKDNSFIGASFNSENSNINSISTTLTEFESYNKILYGFTYNHKSLTLNNSLSDSKFLFQFGFEFGNRQSNNISVTQQQLTLSAHYNFNLNQKGSIFIKNSNKILLTKIPLINELYRIGGTSSIRGFNEQSILTSKYSITNLEYQHKINPKTHIFTITDFGITYNNLDDSTNKIYGVGLGYQSTINSNTIQLSYTIGNELLKPFSLNNSKIHVRFSHVF